MLLGFISIYLMLTFGIGWWASRRVNSSADFVVAGRSLPLFMAACALFATWFGSETVLGASAEFVEGGVLGIIEDPFGASLCLLLAGLLVARPLYKLQLLTFNDFFRIRFNKTSEIISALFMAPSYFSWIAAQLVALSILLHVVAGVDRDLGIIICTVVVLSYTYIGGMWAVAITDFVQTIIIIIGLLALVIDIVWQVGGVGVMIEAAPDDFFQFFPEPKSGPIIAWIAAWMTIGLGSIPQQDIFQRVMSAKSERTAINASYLSAAMYLSIAFMPLIIALGGKMLYPELAEGDSQLLLPALVLQHSGLGMQVLFFGALLSAILSTASGAMLAPATVIGENLVKPLMPHISDKNLLRVMRGAVVFVALVTAAMALSRGNIYELVGESSAFSLVSLFVPLIAGIYWKKASPAGSILAMFVGLIVWFYTQWLGTGLEDASSILWQIPPLMYGLFASAIGMIAGSLIWKRPSIQEQVRSEIPAA
ncbi:MAG: sodium:solute symporter family protein [Saprospiraceae bacterium]